MDYCIGHIALNVSDMDAALRFYREVFGFEEAFRLPHPETGKPWIVFIRTGKEQFLELFYGGVKRIPYEKTNIGFSHLCILTEDMEAFAAHVRKTGYPLTRNPEMGPDGSWQCWIDDPDHNRIEVMQYTEESPQLKAYKR